LKQRLHLLRLLADGEFHGFRELGEALALAPVDLKVQLEALCDDGFELHTRNQSALALATRVEWLDTERIRAVLKPAVRQSLGSIEIFDCIDSTNQRLLQAPPPVTGHGSVCLAEAQSAGRGRLGRSWYSPPAVNLYLSLSWRLENEVAALQGLSLAVGVAVADACERLGAKGIGLKWPNDLVTAGGKLGGILMELRSDCAIIGIGLNVNQSCRQMHAIEQAATSLHTLAHGPVSRNQLAGEILNAAHPVLAGYARDGLGPYRERWQQRDALRGRHVVLSDNPGCLTGVALGIDTNGAYLLETPEGIVPVNAGSLRLRELP